MLSKVSPDNYNNLNFEYISSTQSKFTQSIDNKLFSNKLPKTNEATRTDNLIVTQDKVPSIDALLVERAAFGQLCDIADIDFAIIQEFKSDTESRLEAILADPVKDRKKINKASKRGDLLIRRGKQLYAGNKHVERLKSQLMCHAGIALKDSEGNEVDRINYTDIVRINILSPEQFQSLLDVAYRALDNSGQQFKKISGSEEKTKTESRHPLRHREVREYRQGKIDGKTAAFIRKTEQAFQRGILVYVQFSIIIKESRRNIKRRQKFLKQIEEEHKLEKKERIKWDINQEEIKSEAIDKQIGKK